jgi:N-succinyldiaminopimelate aminotransferase
MNKIARRVHRYGTTIFTEMTNLANEHGAINLGQGFPDFAAPSFLKAAAQQAIAADVNQYAPAVGRLRLRQAVAGKVQRHYGLDVDPEREVLITHGATEAIFAAILGLVDPGDEVIVFEPYYDSYVPAAEMAGGVIRYYTLRPPDWGIDLEELAALFSPKTRLIIINSPHNPTGKVFSRLELARIAELCQEYDALALTDEVYEHILFDGNGHACLATMPGMRDRTMTVSSLGKSFSVTGWKVGWAIAEPSLLAGAFRTHQFMTFCGAAPLQEAAAVALEEADMMGYYGALAADYQARRDLLLEALLNNGLPAFVPAGAYFVLIDISNLGLGDDMQFCRYLTKEIGVAAIPPSAFYHNPSDGAGLARLAFCKDRATLQLAGARLSRLRLP